MEDDIIKDLAQGSFIEKLPSWLRWLLFLPAALVVPILFSTVQRILFQLFILPNTPIFIGANIFNFILDLMGDFILGGGFVYIGAFVAPAKQFLISIILLTLLSIVLFFSFILNLSTLSTTPLIMLIHVITGISTGIYIVYTIHEDEKI